LEFLDLIIDHLTARGVMDPKLLYESPFTDFDNNGVEGVFGSADAAHTINQCGYSIAESIRHFPSLSGRRISTSAE
jgi:hypothetical protein